MKAVYPLGSSRDESARLQGGAPCGGEAGVFWGCSDYAGACAETAASRKSVADASFVPRKGA
jgi:hypothetical protein